MPRRVITPSEYPGVPPTSTAYPGYKEMDLRPDSKLEGQLLDVEKNPPPYDGTGVKKEALTEKEKQILDEMEAKMYEQQSFADFTQNTTFHGVKYVFEDSPFKSRRFIWILFVVAAILGFIIQVSVRTVDYFKYETSIDVFLTFNDSNMDFPALTLCNQNAFRMTKAVDSGLYYFLDEVYGTDNISDVDFTKYNLSGDGDLFLQTTAHQIEDMVDSCHWMGNKCNLSADFVMTMTDMGVCYTFNGDPSNIKQVDETGSALTLVLNVEQYEHMRGPQNDAGVKMLLHDQKDTPLMKELGFAISPGMHTLTSVSLTKRIELIPPWGQCNDTVPPASTCRTQQKARFMAKTCGCRHEAMGNITEARDLPSCTVRDRYDCVISLENNKQNKEKCTVPCERTLYDVSLSYAQLSRVNIDRLALKTEAARNQVEEKFHKAKETLQRVDLTIADKDTNEISVMIEKADILKQGLNESGEFLAEDGNFTQALCESEKQASADAQLVDAIKNNLEEATDMKIDYLKTLVMECFIRDFYSMMYGSGNLTELMSLFTWCFKDVQPDTVSLPQMAFLPNATDEEAFSSCYSKKHGPKNKDPEPEPEPEAEGPPAPPTDEEICTAVIENALTHSENAFRFSTPGINFLLQLETLYETNVKAVFEDTASNYTLYPEYQECDVKVGALMTTYMSMLTTITGNLETFVTSSNMTVMLDALGGFFGIVEDYDLMAFLGQLVELEETCWWMHKTVTEDETEEHHYKDARVKFQKIQNLFTTIIVTVNNVRNFISSIIDHMNENIYPVLEVARLYLTNDVTKLEMSEYFVDVELSKAVDDLITMNKELSNYVKQYDNLVETGKIDITYAVKELFATYIPAMKTETIRSFNMIQYASSIPDPYLASLSENLADDREANMKEMIHYTLEEYFQKPMREISQKISPLVTQLTKDIVKMQTKSEAYIAECEMSKDFYLNNFLQIDIFYKDLSFETIQQLESFTGISLLSEVGGFLGLLLGASVLTMCEIIDFFVMFCIKSYHKRKLKKQEAEKEAFVQERQQAAGANNIAMHKLMHV